MMSAGTIIYTITASTVTKCVSPQEIGTVIGLDTGITNCIRVLAPFIGTHLAFLWGNYDVVGVACGFIMSVSIAIQLKNHNK